MGGAMSSGVQKWQSIANESYIKEAGWYFKTLAVQEIGKSCLISIFYYFLKKHNWSKLTPKESFYWNKFNIKMGNSFQFMDEWMELLKKLPN